MSSIGLEDLCFVVRKDVYAPNQQELSLSEELQAPPEGCTSEITNLLQTTSYRARCDTKQQRVDRTLILRWTETGTDSTGFCATWQMCT